MLEGWKAKGNTEEMQRQLLQKGAATYGAGNIGSIWACQTGRLGARLMELRPDLRKGYACYAARGTMQKKHHQEDRFPCLPVTSTSTSCWEKLNKMCHGHGKTGPEEYLSIVTQEGQGPIKLRSIWLTNTSQLWLHGYNLPTALELETTAVMN